MTRFLFPFLIALTIHGLISLVSWEQKQVQRPKAGGERSIVIELDNLYVPKELQQIEPREAASPPQPNSPQVPVDVQKTEESLLQPPLTEPEKVQIKPVKRKLVKKRSSETTTPAPNVHTSSPPKEQKQHTESSVLSNTFLTQNAPQEQRPASIQAKPLYQKNPKPPYPPLARRRNWQGTVLLLVTVDIQGLSEKVKILKRSGYSILDRAAQKTVQQWKFTPGQINGHPTVMEVQVPIHFLLE